MNTAETQAGDDAEWIGGRKRLDGTVHLAEYAPSWGRIYEREARRIRAVLGSAAMLLEHVGSTSVPGLAAKAIVDIVLAVADPGDETSYVPMLVSAGYTLRVREAKWYQHRLLKKRDRVNLHVFPSHCEEVTRMLAFRDRLRRDSQDRELYERTKRALAACQWAYMQDYADAKAEVIAEIMSHVCDDTSTPAVAPSETAAPR
jgi:GrpB-like predicted nucleotidyltransferase (UPF0157 family)